MFIENTTPSM